MTAARLLPTPALAAGLALAGIGAASAAGIGTGGPLELTVSGFAAVQAHGGALDDQRQDAALSTGLDFSTDTEVHVLLRARDDATGLEYGGTVELNADTSDTLNAEKSWLFLRGGFGEIRLGDEDGLIEESALGAYTHAAGTGGIDGEVIDEIAVDAVRPTNSEKATKLRYYTPSFDGFQLAVSYAPDEASRGDSLALKDTTIAHWVEGAVIQEGELGEAELQASLVGGWGRVRDREEFGGRGELWSWYAGAAAELFDVGIGAGFGEESVAGLEKRYLNAGIALGIEELNLSLSYGQVLRTRGYEGVGEPWNLVLSADLELVEGVLLAGDLAYVANDLDAAAEAPTGGDSGWVWVARIELAF